MDRRAVFISYRRADAAFECDQIQKSLKKLPLNIKVFKDIDSIPLGSNFRDVLFDAIDSSNVMLVLIGEAWLDAREKSGNRRLDNPSDYIRLEIERALDQQVRIIPVLLGMTQLPRDDELPKSIRSICRFQIARVRPEPDFSHDLTRLTKSVFELFPLSTLERLILLCRSLLLLYEIKNAAGQTGRFMFYIFAGYLVFLGAWAMLDIEGAMRWDESKNYSDFVWTFIGGFVLVVMSWLLGYSQKR